MLVYFENIMMPWLKEYTQIYMTIVLVFLILLNTYLFQHSKHSYRQHWIIALPKNLMIYLELHKYIIDNIYLIISFTFNSSVMLVFMKWQQTSNVLCCWSIFFLMFSLRLFSKTTYSLYLWTFLVLSKMIISSFNS